MSAGTPLRIGLIGCGRISQAHLRAAVHPERVRFTAVADINEAAARKRGAELGLGEGAIYTDPWRLIREAGCDAIDICTTHESHAPLAIAAAEAGRHVLLEKPMARTADECRAILAAAGKAGITLMVAQNQRYMANHRVVRRVIQSGEIGAVRAVRVESLGGGGGRDDSSWVYDGASAGGGVIMSLAIHRIDLARFFVGEVRRVWAVCRTFDSRFRNGAEDWCSATLEFANGALGQVHATFSAYRPPWAETFIVFGEKGTIHATPPARYHGPAMIASTSRGPWPIEGMPGRMRHYEPLPEEDGGLPSDNMHINEVLHFADCCHSGQEPVSSGRDNFKTMQVAFAIYESARKGGGAVEVCSP